MSSEVQIFAHVVVFILGMLFGYLMEAESRFK